MQATLRFYKFGGFMLTFITAFMAVSNYSSYSNPSEVAQLQESISVAIQEQEKSFGTEETTDVYVGFKENLTTYLTELRYAKSSLLKIIGSFIALIGSVFIRRKQKIGIHLFLGGMLFGILGTFYYHSLGVSGWSLATWPILFTAVVGFFVYRKREVFT
ncbi:MAG: hypothetical protein HOI49_08760 [Bacteroidetes bacterium]|nr:hypothetical protein [Bacteroidota bacterium]